MKQASQTQLTASVMETHGQAMSLQADYPPGFDMDFVKRLLGRKATGNLTRATKNRLAHMHEGVHRLLEPRVVWRVLPVSAIERGQVKLTSGLILKSHKMSSVMSSAEQLVLFVATIGKKIDKKVDQLMDQGKIANAYTCDVLGSGAAESVAERFQADFGLRLSQQTRFGYTAAGIRFSPGYCDWSVTEQDKLFSLVDAGAIDVTLSKTSLMTPRKSISAVFGLYPKEKGGRLRQKRHNPCLYCSKKDCLARRSPVCTLDNFSLPHDIQSTDSSIKSDKMNEG